MAITTANITVAGTHPSADQVDAIKICLGVAQSENAGPFATKAMLVAGIGESGFSRGAKDFDTGTHQGVFQSNQIPASDVAGQCKAFLTGGPSFGAGGAIKAHKDHPEWTVGQVAGHVEVSGRNYTTGDPFYDKWGDEADRIMAADDGDYGDGSSPAGSTEAPSSWSRGANETSAAAISRLAQDVRWAAYIDYRKGKPVLVFLPELSDQRVNGRWEYDLFRQKSVATFDVMDERIVDWSFDVDTGKITQEMNITIRCEPWHFRVGTPVTLKNVGGLVSKKWLIAEIRRDVFEPVSEILLRQPLLEKKESAPEESDDTSDGSADGSDGDTPTDVKFEGTPKHIIDTYVLPVGRDEGAHTPPGAELTPTNNDVANHQHTHLGSASDHAGPPNVKWAADLSIGPDVRYGNAAGAKIGDAIAKKLAEMFGIDFPESGGIRDATHDGYRFQLIWRYEDPQAGNHYTHVHFGVRKA